MPVIFPPVETASPEGLLAIGGQLDTETLLTAYKQGIFPWPISHDSPLTWFSPDPRGILPLADFKINKSFKKFIKKNNYEVVFNKDFKNILINCAKTPRKHEDSTWITQEILKGYQQFFEAGFAYCVGVYNEEKLVGGLYGVCIGKYFSGESMFHLEPNTSKLALYSLVQELKKAQIEWIDTQMVTPIIASFGGIHIPREDFLKELETVINQPIMRKQILP